MTKTKRQITNDKKLTFAMISLIAIASILVFSNPSLIYATLIGDEITITLKDADSFNNPESPGVTDTVIIGQEPKFQWGDALCGNDDGVSVDIEDSTITVSIFPGFGLAEICNSSEPIDDPLDFTIEDLNWIDFPGAFLTGIVVTSNDSSLTTTQEVTGKNSVHLTIDSFETEGGVVEFTLEKAVVMTASKTWTYTDYNWDPICDADFDGVPDDPCESEDRLREIDRPLDDVLADPLPITTVSDVDKFTAFAQVHKNGKFSNTNPGAFYALTTVVATSSLSSIEILENYEDCTNDKPIADGDLGLKIHNANKSDRSIKAAIADPEGKVTEISDYLYDNGLISSDNNYEDSAKIEIDQEIEAGSTVFVLVKFQDDLKGYDTEDGIFDGMCHNEETVTAYIDGGAVQEVLAEADLRITNDIQ